MRGHQRIVYYQLMQRLLDRDLTPGYLLSALERECRAKLDHGGRPVGFLAQV